MSFLERFDPLSRYRYRKTHPVELLEMVGPIVVGAGHHVRPEPRPCELPHCPVLLVEAAVIH